MSETGETRLRVESAAPVSRGPMSGARDALVWLALIVALAGPLTFALAGLGTRAGLWDFRFGLGVMARQVAPVVLFAGLGLAILALIATFLVRPRGRGIVIALVALVIPAAALYQAGATQAAARAIPPIHDVTTDPDDPPEFSEGIAERRGPDANPLDLDFVLPEFAGEFAGRSVRVVGGEFYDNLATMRVVSGTGETFDAALDAAEDMGWEIALADPEEGRIEAVATTFWFGFKDDIVVRIRPAGMGSEVDVRSVSRVGFSDLGTNAARIADYSEELADELAD